MSKKIIKLIPIFVIVVVVLVNLRWFIIPGFPQTHDGEMQLARVANYYLGLRFGQFPVRWAPNLNYQFGYPVFNFNYPLLYVLPVPFYVLGLSFENSMKLVLFAAYLSAGVFMYWWLKEYFGKLSSLAGAVFYLCVPYFFINLYIRGSYGELLALALLPGSLLFIKRLINRFSKTNVLMVFFLSLSLALSHNIYFMLLFPLIVIYALYLLKGKFMQIKLLLPLLFGFSTSAFFWIPALWEKQYITLQAIPPDQYQEHFLYLRQLISSFWQFGFSLPGPNDTMPLFLGWPSIVVLIISVISGILEYKKKKKITPIVWILMLVVFLVMLMTGYSGFVYKVITPLAYIQFPWRWLGIVGFVLSVLFACILNIWLKKVKTVKTIVLVFFMVLTMVYTFQFTKPHQWEQKEDMMYLQFPFTGSLKNENMPKWFDQQMHLKFTDEYQFLDGEVVNAEKAGHRHNYQLDNPTADELSFYAHLAYYPGWEALLDNIPTNIDFMDQKYPGLIKVSVPPGKHGLKIIFTEKTPARIIGDTLSIISLLAFIYLLIKHKKAVL